jgi:hypothetical protein
MMLAFEGVDGKSLREKKESFGEERGSIDSVDGADDKDGSEGIVDKTPTERERIREAKRSLK